MLGLARALVSLPLSWLLALGRWLGRIIRRHADYRRHVVHTNLELCFPQLDDWQRLDLERRTFESFGMGLFEEAMGWWVSNERLARYGRVEGAEHLHEALARGKGVILLCAHVTCLEVCGRILQHEVKTAFSYREQKNALLDLVIRRSRDHWAAGGAPASDPRAMLRYLKDNKVLWFAPDQDFGPRYSVFAPFFGIPAATTTTLSRLAKLSGAAVVPFHNQRLPGNRRYLVRLEPALADFPSNDPLQDAERMNRILETWIKEAPEQYLWSHRRFKTRPPGQLKVYRPKRGYRPRLPGEPN